MKAIELKAGDWILYKENLAKIHCTNPPCVCIEVDTQLRWMKESDKDLSPVLLTEEILLSNGWEFDREDYCIYEQDLVLRPQYEHYVLYRGVNEHIRLTDIKYVHELQNALWGLNIDDRMNFNCPRA